jgi:gamma-glutamylcyclotransferase
MLVEMKIFYFAYGSNLSLEQMTSRCPDHMLIGKAVLQGFRLDYTLDDSYWKCGVADIIPEKAACVWGLLYQISAKDLVLLDDYEDVVNDYRRFKVSVKHNNVSTQAWTYEVMNKNFNVKPSDEYLAIRRTAAQKYEFPE